MARQPDIQYIQMYNYGSTARKLELKPRVQQKKYELPEQTGQAAQVHRERLDPLSVCAIVAAGFMLVALLVGMFRISGLSARHQELERYIADLREQRAALQVAYEKAYVPEEVAARAAQMGLVDADRVRHIDMGTLNTRLEEESGLGETLVNIWNELFAKAPSLG